MGLRINTNVSSLVAQRNMRATLGNIERNLAHLSTGSRINQASDDAAGLAVSEIMKAQIKGLAQSERNALDGISVLQIAEGSLVEISNILIRLKELTVQASSDTISDHERQFINIEFQKLLEEINRISNATEYNNIPLLNGTAVSFDIQIGPGNNPDVDRLNLFDMNPANVNIANMGLETMNIEDKLNAQNSLSKVDSAINMIAGIRSHLGATQNRLQVIINNLSITRENLSAANSRIRDTDIAEEASEHTRNQILLQSGISVLAQTNIPTKAALSLLTNGGGMG